MAFRPRFLAQIDAARLKYSEESGLVYGESSISSDPIYRTWQYRSKGEARHLEARNKRGDGAATLRQVLIRKIARHAVDLEFESFRDIPWMTVRQVWEFLQAHDLVSLHVWKVFAQAYPSTLRHHKINAGWFVPSGLWSASLKPLNAPATTFITLLDISNTQAHRLDLLSLPEIKNLGTLSIGPGLTVIAADGRRQRGIDDAILRSWANNALDSGVLASLRFVSFHAQESLTENILEPMLKMPNLGMVVVEGWPAYSISQRASASAIPSWQIQESGKDCEGERKSSWWEDRQLAFTANGKVYASKYGQEAAEVVNELPILHCELRAQVGLGESARSSNAMSRICCTRTSSASATRDESLELLSGKRPGTQVDGQGKGRQVRARRLQSTADTLSEFGA